MQRHRIVYEKTEFVSIGWVVTATGLPAGEIMQAIARREFPPPTTNADVGTPLWFKPEILEWIDRRGVWKTLRRRAIC